MPSFDIVSETDLQEVDNAVNSCVREIQNRYDFKGSKSELKREAETITLLADDDMKHKAIIEMLKTYITRRKLDIKCLDFQKPESASGGMIRQIIKVKKGIDQENAKKIVKQIKDSKIKVQASIQSDQVRVTGKNRDDLQEAIQLVRSSEIELPLQFINFRD
ncbi:MAG: YajQ family cyclic di-GMP-binding protein [Rickettsiales bacterium]|nr:YajQ family cyclic di-GMP-binding protein [Rickettsiales bacterium]